MSALVACCDAVLSDSDPNILARIWEPEVHLALWKRPLPLELASLASLVWDKIDDIDDPVSRDTLETQVPALIEAAGYGSMARPLLREIIPLCERFAAIMDCMDMKMRLEVIETDACRRFHADNVAARMLMPLVGAGTQWIHAGRKEPVHELLPGEVGLFKGWKWTDDPHILHRSPPVADTGQTRLLFALSSVTD